MEVSTREVERIFKKLQVRDRRSTHHVAGIIRIDGVAQLPVHYSRGRNGLAGRSAHSFRKSLRLKADEFAILKRCTMSREDYLLLVKPRVQSE